MTASSTSNIDNLTGHYVDRIRTASLSYTDTATWVSLAADLAYFAHGRSYADIDALAGAIGTARAECIDPDPTVGAVLDTIAAMLGAAASAAMRDEGAAAILGN